MTVLTPVGSQLLITLLAWALECPSALHTRLQMQAEEKDWWAPAPRSKRQGKHLSQGQGGRPRLAKQGLVEGAALLLPAPGWASSRPHCRALQGAAWWGQQAEGRERKEALLELVRGNFVGKGDKKHQKESQGVWRGAWWIKFSASWARR